MIVGEGHFDEVCGKIFAHALLQIAVGKLGEDIRQRIERLFLLGFDTGALSGASGSLFGRERAGAFGFSLQPDIFEGSITEDADRAHHVADLVAAIAAVDRDFQVAACKARHHVGDALQRTTQGFHEHEATDDGKQRADDHGDDRDIGRALAVFLAEFLRLGDEAAQRGHRIGKKAVGLNTRGLPIGRRLQQIGRSIGQAVDQWLHVCRKITHGGVGLAEFRDPGSNALQILEIRNHRLARCSIADIFHARGMQRQAIDEAERLVDVIQKLFLAINDLVQADETIGSRIAVLGRLKGHIALDLDEALQDRPHGLDLLVGRAGALQDRIELVGGIGGIGDEAGAAFGNQCLGDCHLLQNRVRIGTRV